MAEEYVRELNKSVSVFAAPLLSSEPPASRGVVNELAFRLFAKALALDLTVTSLPSDAIAAGVVEAVTFIRSFRQANRVAISEPSATQIEEAQILAQRLSSFFKRTPRSLISVEPVFRGCGWLDECVGDVVVMNALIEVKAGERLFRSLDLRQLLAYCALNFSSKTREIVSVSLVNPRLGLSFQGLLEEVSRGTAGRSAGEVLGDIVEYISEPNDRYLS